MSGRLLLVPDGLAGDRVDAAAARMLGLSRSRIAGLIETGAVRLDGEPVTKPSTPVRPGAMLEVELTERPSGVPVVPQTVEGIRIVHDDADLVVVDKPVGVAAHPSLGWEGPSVVEHLAAAGFGIATSGAAERQGIVQRLDVGTSGLMVVAKSEHAYSVLKQAFRDRTVDKVYQGLAQGHLDPPLGTIDAPIGRHPSGEWKMTVAAGGRPSVTHYDTLEVFRGATLLELHLETGRTHQIRVHLSAIRHPLAGDATYGADPVLARRLGLERQWLHAVRLGFVHPGTGERVEFSSEPPADLVHALGVLREE
ncbi:RluA family pseudouridine synthase [Naumannella cuiyingiana]|uniref:Pseudouridine synthase n=1 Tax=Naumannella cuiyingiana TaxID=1347891 RepID=A0A7Z0ILZ1_9ACTN|nr:RluA family pseudouridine synthase [Naumannella cuiyingiana]NYI72110.1 23S rRNA pseudouridine1911/1915/1917 synthase [Naumannella cuiyingiana]